jgi:hypothetical protein
MIAKQPKSMCKCGHSGDGPESQHDPRYAEGHGPCHVEGCDCEQFTWAGWTIYGQRLVDEAKAWTKRTLGEDP